MKLLILLSALLFSFSTLAQNLRDQIKVMNFNIMCDICGNRANYGSFNQRIVSIADTLNRHKPDLISLQEFRTKRQLQKMLKLVKKSYNVIYAVKRYWSYTDTILLVSKERFKIQQSGGFWLGPNPRLPIGWGIAIPRRFEWVKILDQHRGEELVFAGSHFDNGSTNKIASAKVVNNFFKNQTSPIIFAADSNIKAYDSGYSNLIGNNMSDTFPGLSRVEYVSNSTYNKNDACNTSKAETFPECRIEHVLFSKSSSWAVKSWAVDLFRYHGKLGFTSDHRAVIVVLE